MLGYKGEHRSSEHNGNGMERTSRIQSYLKTISMGKIATLANRKKCSEWNRLPWEVVGSSSLEELEQRLVDHLSGML